MPSKKQQFSPYALTHWRIERGFSQHGMADLMGCHVNTVIEWEHSGRVHPRWFRQMQHVTEEYLPLAFKGISPLAVPPLQSVDASSLKNWREELQLSIPALAKRLGCTGEMVAQWEMDGRISRQWLDYMRLIDEEEKFAKSLVNPPDFLLITKS